MIAIGSDHGGYDLKMEIISYLNSQGLECKDFGSCNGKESVDYPDYGKTVAEAVSSGEFEKGIIICGTGLGISITANKVPGIRAALCTDSYMARMSREHNDANVLALGGRVVGPGLALDIVETWLNTPFAGGRHKTRVDKISAVETKYLKK
ncbi:MAG: ribose 5-phosphate isomerase B [Clostridiales bacterium GWC2_40_7]|nr:MAG: ribose 5-phosphate isomerase B [Clostridiales bacterium GWC2_40_7]